MNSSRPTTIRAETSLRSVSPNATDSPVPASFRYDPADPYAVHLRFWSEHEPVSWSFARELLLTGLNQQAGVGDVPVHPSPWITPGSETMTLSLSSPDGQAQFEVRRKVIVKFLRRSYALVPRDHETHYQDVDAAIARLLGSA